MAIRRCLFSDRRRIAARVILVEVLLTTADAAASETRPTELPGDAVDLRAQPELQQIVHGKFLRPTADELVNAVREQTGLPVTLDDSVIRDRPLGGYTEFAQTPAWAVMTDWLADCQYVQGQWRKIGAEYRLFAGYKGPPPPLPPPFPAHVDRAVLNNTEVGEDAELELSSAKHWTAGRVAASLLSILAVLAVGGFLLWRQRSANLKSH